MKIEPLELNGLYVLSPEPISDRRGFFARSFSRDAMQEHGLDTLFPEWSISFNHRAGTLRGLHLQSAPYAETKIVQCVRGAIFDVGVDLRRGSKTYGRHASIELSEENRKLFYIPKGFAHGFQTLTDNAEVHYHISETFRSDYSRGVRWDDRKLGISWPDVSERTISARDEGLPLFAEFSGA